MWSRGRIEKADVSLVCGREGELEWVEANFQN